MPRAKDFFASFPPDRRLLFCTYLKVYIERTKASHPTASGSKNPLFLSYIKPHGPVTSSTLARWVKSTLAQAGIDTRNFKLILRDQPPHQLLMRPELLYLTFCEQQTGPQFLPSLSFIISQCAKALLQK